MHLSLQLQVDKGQDDIAAANSLAELLDQVKDYETACMRPGRYKVRVRTVIHSHFLK